MKSEQECTCMCHRGQNIRHFIACCGPGSINKEFLKKAVEREADSEVGIERPRRTAAKESRDA